MKTYHRLSHEKQSIEKACSDVSTYAGRQLTAQVSLYHMRTYYRRIVSDSAPMRAVAVTTYHLIREILLISVPMVISIQSSAVYVLPKLIIFVWYVLL